MVILIQRRGIGKLKVDCSNVRRGMLPPFKTIWSGSHPAWFGFNGLKDFIHLNFGEGDYLVRFCQGGNKNLVVRKIFVKA